MYRILLLDVDGVLSRYGEPIKPGIANRLRKLSKKIEIIPISGKNISYLEGLFRGIGITPKCIIGENGGCIYFPDKLEEFTYFHENPQFIEVMRETRYKINKILFQKNLKVWFRENKVVITCLTDKPELLEELIRHYINLEYCDILKYSFAIQVIPKGLNKGWAVTKLSNILGISLQDFIAVGDDERDVPMFKKVGLSISIGDNALAKQNSSLNFVHIEEALNYIFSILTK